MGGTVLTQSNDSGDVVRTLNLNNPAAISTIGVTNIDVGLDMKWYNVSDSVSANTTFQGNFGHLAVGFPVWINRSKPKNPRDVIGAAFGLKPYSRIGYNIASKNNLNGDSSVFKGQGGGTNAFVSVGIKPWKYLSFGFTASYVWGNAEHLRTYSPNTDSTVLSIGIKTIDNFTGFQFSAGIQAEIPLSKKTSIKLGGIFEPLATLNNAHVDFLYNFRNNGGTEVIRDTIVYTRDAHSSMRLPSGFGAGISLVRKTRWQLAADIYVQNWAATSSSYSSIQLKNMVRSAVGFEWVPNAASSGKLSFIKRTSYRVGGFFTQTPIPGNTRVNQYGVTFGLGLRLKEMFKFLPPSQFNIGVELSERGKLSETGIRERYAKVYFGLIISDKWFNKRKID